jgi:hypothetical protein
MTIIGTFLAIAIFIAFWWILLPILALYLIGMSIIALISILVRAFR